MRAPPPWPVCTYVYLPASYCAPARLQSMQIECTHTKDVRTPGPQSSRPAREGRWEVYAESWQKWHVGNLSVGVVVCVRLSVQQRHAASAAVELTNLIINPGTNVPTKSLLTHDNKPATHDLAGHHMGRCVYDMFCLCNLQLVWMHMSPIPSVHVNHCLV